MIVLFNPASSSNRKPVLPMSLLALGALLENDFEYQIIDGNLVTDPLATLDERIRQAPRALLAVTVMPGPQLSQAVPICRALKKKHRNLDIVWGGYFPTQHPEVCLDSGYVDFVLRGHAEHSFRALVDKWQVREDPDPSDITGLCSCRAGQKIVGSLPDLPSPQQLPDFPYDRVPMARYLRPTFMGRTISHHSSYGCPFFCNFCAVVNMVKGRWKAQSAERTAATVEMLKTRYGAEAVEFQDNNFFVDEKRVADFADRIEHLEMQWWGEARIDTLLGYADESWRAMADSGLRMVFLGAESGSDQTLKRMQKGGTASAEKTLVLAEKAARYEIIPEFSFVLGNPPDPEADVEQSLQFIRRVKKVNPVSEIILYLYTPVPLRGDLYEESCKTGFQFPATLEEWIRPEWLDFSQRRSSRLPWLSDHMIRRIRSFERVLNAYYPTTTDRKLGGFRRMLLRAAGGWRYRLGFYHFPLELSVMQRWFHYQRPEVSGF